LQHRPINASSVAFGNDAMVNALPLNGFWSVNQCGLSDEE